MRNNAYCRIPVETGTLVVFSNYQVVHRVLRMVRNKDVQRGVRDFVAFFVVDQRHPLPLVPDTPLSTADLKEA